MASYATIHSPLGIPLADISSSFFRAWAYNAPSEAEFDLSIRDNKVTEDILRFGNMLLIRHDTLPDWVGFIDFPRVWNNGFVSVTAISAEQYFWWRVFDPHNITAAHSQKDYWGPREFITEMVIQCAGKNGLRIGLGNDIYNGTQVCYYGQNATMAEALVELNNNGIDWDVTPSVSPSGILQIEVNTYRKSGIKSLLELDESNSRAVDPILTENGPIFNAVTMMSEAGPGGGRVFASAQNSEYIPRNGLREKIATGRGRDASELLEQAEVEIDKSKDATMVVAPTVLNVGTTFARVRNGNLVVWTSPNAGVSGETVGTQALLTIKGMEYDDSTDEVTLVAEDLPGFRGHNPFSAENASAYERAER